jgi:hypothetical protein
MELLELENYTITGRGVRATSRIGQSNLAEVTPWGLFDHEKRLRERQARVKAWDKLTKKLIDWSRDPSRLEDDGIEAPSQSVLSRAYDVALALRLHDFLPFDRVVPTGDGGIAFASETDDELVSLEIDADGTMELFHFRGPELAFRTRLALPVGNDG